MPNVWNSIYLGTAPIIDPTEGNTLAENAAALVGQTFGAINDPLLHRVVEVTANDLNGDASLNQNNNISNDTFTADIGAGLQTFVFDAATAYSVTITYANGSTTTATLVLFQSTTGQTFIAPGLTPAANAALLSQPLRSITINSVVTNNTLGLNPVRLDLVFLTCFVAGTPILTPDGEVPVECLRPGDAVATLDNGVQRLIWVGQCTVSGHGRHAPIRFATGAIGNPVPLEVSPQHRMLIRGWRAELLFGEPEVLVAACHLVNGDRISRAPRDSVTYVHLMFDRHEIVHAAGVPSESFNPGADVLRENRGIRAELAALFPDLSNHLPDGPLLPPSRPLTRGIEARALRGGGPFGGGSPSAVPRADSPAVPAE